LIIKVCSKPTDDKVVSSKQAVEAIQAEKGDCFIHPCKILFRRAGQTIEKLLTL